MIYTYACAECTEVVELNCPVSERETQEKALHCPACGGAKLVRVFNAFIARRADGSLKATFGCGPNPAPGCCSRGG